MRRAMSHLSTARPQGRKEITMEKKQAKKASTLTLRTETLRRLDDAHLPRVAGGARLRVPVGYGDDTTPIYDTNDTTGG